MANFVIITYVRDQSAKRQRPCMHSTLITPVGVWNVAPEFLTFSEDRVKGKAGSGFSHLHISESL
jgi:hypothetical protein